MPITISWYKHSICLVGSLLGSFYWPYSTPSAPEANDILVQAWLCSLAKVLCNCIMNHSRSYGGSSHTVREAFLDCQADNVSQVGRTTGAEALEWPLSDSYDLLCCLSEALLCLFWCENYRCSFPEGAMTFKPLGFWNHWMFIFLGLNKHVIRTNCNNNSFSWIKFKL